MKVFKLNDYDWYMANTLEEAIATAVKDTGLPPDEATDNPHEVSKEMMEKLIFVDDDEKKSTFTEHLNDLIAAGATPQMFASELS